MLRNQGPRPINYQGIPEDSIPEDFKCPIMLEAMTDPVVAEDGQTYERADIVDWLARNPVSPLTREPMTAQKLITNFHLRSQIMSWIDGWLRNHPEHRKQSAPAQELTPNPAEPQSRDIKNIVTIRHHATQPSNEQRPAHLPPVQLQTTPQALNTRVAFWTRTHPVINTPNGLLFRSVEPGNVVTPGCYVAVQIQYGPDIVVSNRQLTDTQLAAYTNGVINLYPATKSMLGRVNMQGLWNYTACSAATRVKQTGTINNGPAKLIASLKPDTAGLYQVDSAQITAWMSENAPNLLRINYPKTGDNEEVIILKTLACLSNAGSRNITFIPTTSTPLPSNGSGYISNDFKELLNTYRLQRNLTRTPNKQNLVCVLGLRIPTNAERPSWVSCNFPRRGEYLGDQQLQDVVSVTPLERDENDCYQALCPETCVRNTHALNNERVYGPVGQPGM